MGPDRIVRDDRRLAPAHAAASARTTSRWPHASTSSTSCDARSAVQRSLSTRCAATVSIVETASFKVVGTVETGRGAHGVVVDPSSRHAYVTNIYGGKVAVLDLAQRKVVARIPVGEKPNGISFSPVVPSVRPARSMRLPLRHDAEESEHSSDETHEMDEG